MEMHGLEKLLLKSPAWRLATRTIILPWVLGVGIRPATDVLEVGTGAGFNAEALLKRFPDWQLVATDFDPEMVASARQRLSRFGPRVRLETADATNLPFPDRSFDLVLSVLVWHHVGDWPRATHEAARVLRPGGNLLLADIYGHRRLGLIVSQLVADLPAYSKDELVSAVSHAGFESLHLKQFARIGYSLIASRKAQ
jgi:ubiquinone/menaquinone biosynthesis C-methylase UbiE